MKTIAFFDTKPYDREWFDKFNTQYEIRYLESKLTPATVQLAAGSDAVCAFVNDTVNAEVIDKLYELGVRVLAMRCAGYSNVDFERAYGKINVVRVPAYSPYAVAEHAMALLLDVNRKLYRAYNRTRDFNFSLVGLTGIDLHGKTVGVIGTGKIGRTFMDICKGLGMKVIAYDLYPAKDSGIDYVSLDELLMQSDVISLHCPLNDQTRNLLGEAELKALKLGCVIINVGRGGLVDETALIAALKYGGLGGAGFDVITNEPPTEGNPLVNTHLPHLIVTPHMAWGSQEAMTRLFHMLIDNINKGMAGTPQSVVAPK